MRARLLPVAAAMLFAAAAHTAQLPEAGPKDKRVRVATYDPYDVFTIYTQVAMGTAIHFEADEKVVDIVGGDTKAWGVDTMYVRNGIFIKPAAVMPDSNLQVITNKHKYTFDLKLANLKKGQSGFMTVYFRYPAAERAANSAAKEAERVRTLLDTAAPVGNRRYSVQGAADLSPVEAWDDGKSTFLRFRTRGNLPAAYAARDGDDALEQIENTTIKDGVMQIPAVRRKFVLRIGQQVACVFNDGYNANAPRPATNTVSDYVKRIMKGASK
jgi:type IV secretion system protein VirB9